MRGCLGQEKMIGARLLVLGHKWLGRANTDNYQILFMFSEVRLRTAVGDIYCLSFDFL